jgi:hypothetical protein
VKETTTINASYDMVVKIIKCITCHAGSNKKLPTSGDNRSHFQHQFVTRTSSDETTKVWSKLAANVSLVMMISVVV